MSSCTRILTFNPYIKQQTYFKMASVKEHQENQEHLDRVHQMVVSNNHWEQKMMAKGYRYVQDLREPVPTYVFASPKKQEIMAKENQLFLEKQAAIRKKYGANV